MPYSYPSAGPVRTRTRYKPRLRWGLLWGSVYAAAASAVAIVVSIGRQQVFFAEFGPNGMTLWRILASYWIAGGIAGFLLGLMHPLAARRFGAVLLGCVLGFVAYAVVGVAMLGFRPLAFGIALIPAVLGGGGLGLVRYDEQQAKIREAAN